MNKFRKIYFIVLCNISEILEYIGEDESEPELAHILLCLAEKEQVAGVGDRVDEQRDDENGEEAGFGRLGRAGVETEERIV